MEIFPEEIQWNIMKYMRHPIAEAFLDELRIEFAMEAATYTKTHVLWNDVHEEERWYAGIFREVYFNNGNIYMD